MDLFAAPSSCSPTGRFLRLPAAFLLLALPAAETLYGTIRDGRQARSIQNMSALRSALSRAVLSNAAQSIGLARNDGGSENTIRVML